MTGMRRSQTPFIRINPRNSTGCQLCVESRPKNVLGKVGFLWHKHIAIRNTENCIGCKNCIKACPNGVFKERGNETKKQTL